MRRQHNDRIEILLALVNSNAVVFSILALEDKRWTTDQPARQEHRKSLRILRRFRPAVRILDRRKGQIQRIFRSSRRALAEISDHMRVSFFALQRANLAEQRFSVVFLQLKARDHAGSVRFRRRFSPERHIRLVDIGRKEIFPFDLRNRHPDTPWGRSVNDVEIWIVRAWWPGAARPVPNQRFLASFRKNIPQLLRLAETAVKIIGNLVNIPAQAAEVRDAVHICVAAAGQRRPHWRRHRRMAAEHHKILARSAAADKFCSVRHLAFV